MQAWGRRVGFHGRSSEERWSYKENECEIRFWVEQQNQSFRLGVTESDVVLEDLGSVFRDHEAGEQHANEGEPCMHARRFVQGSLVVIKIPTLFPHTVDRGLKRLLSDAVQDIGSSDRSGRICAHTTCVGTGIALANTLVVLRSGQGGDGVAVGKGKYGHFRSGQELLNNNFLT